MRLPRPLLCGGGLLFLAACGSSSSVTWTWSPGDVNHNVTFQDGPASATQSSGTYQRTFTTAGTYPYYCSIHKTSYGMVGTIVVQ